MKYVIAFGVDLLSNAVFFIGWFHFELDERFKQYRISRGRKLEERRLAGPDGKYKHEWRKPVDGAELWLDDDGMELEKY